MGKQVVDIIIIGSGPAGYIAAIKAAQLGFKVICIEKTSSPGGTCLNVGCIPSKSLLHQSHEWHKAQSWSKAPQTSADNDDVCKISDTKASVVAKMTGGIKMLFKKNKVTYKEGTASFTGPDSIEVRTNKGPVEEWSASKAIVIASGSSPVRLKDISYDEKDVCTSDGALDWRSLPKKLLIVGGGYIGLEMGTVWAHLGSKVIVLEGAPSILSNMDTSVQQAMHKILSGKGIEIHTNMRLSKIHPGQGCVDVEAIGADGQSTSFKVDKVLTSVGRVPHTADLGLDKAGVATDERGFVVVDDLYRTNIDKIYAIGDVIGGAMLAHKAEKEAVVCIENLTKTSGYKMVNYGIIPSVVYTSPEIASVGKTHQELDKAGVSYIDSTFPFQANARAHIVQQAEHTFVKMLVEKQTHEVLGAHIVGPEASSLIHEVALAMEFGASAQDIACMCHAHPTFSEAVKEAALGAFGPTLNF